MYVPRLNAPGRAPSARALGAGYVVGRRLTFNNLIDYFVRSIPSDIKSTAAFLKWPSHARGVRRVPRVL